jgi:hypothetical protein
MAGLDSARDLEIYLPKGRRSHASDRTILGRYCGHVLPGIDYSLSSMRDTWLTPALDVTAVQDPSGVPTSGGLSARIWATDNVFFHQQM